jgi:hypothetical protein
MSGAHGTDDFRLECQPAFNYARDPHLTRISATGAVFDSSELVAGAKQLVPLEKKRSRRARASSRWMKSRR